MSYFSAERVAELNAGRAEVCCQFRELQERLILHTYNSERGKEHATHGLCRRLNTLARAIDQVYDLLPPEQEEIPDRNNVLDATIAIHAFTMNAFGCLENIAWIWLFEKDIRNNNGSELDPKDVSLRKKSFNKRLTIEFRNYLAEKDDWFKNLINFRDSLAHRIPLFIPPYIVTNANIVKYNELEAAMRTEPARSNQEEHNKIKTSQLDLCKFLPGMTHSIFENESLIEFHSQLLNDYVSIDEHARILLQELDR